MQNCNYTANILMYAFWSQNLTYPIGDISLKFAKLMFWMSFILIAVVVLFVCVFNTDKRPKSQCQLRTIYQRQNNIIVVINNK